MGKVSSKQFSLPVLKFDHLYRLTDETGILEHCYFAIPDRSHGYTTDDNARALQVCVKLGDRISNREKLIDTYLKFLIFAKNDNGFLNDLRTDLRWENCPNPLGEHFGRVMNALAETSLLSSNKQQRRMSARIFDQQSITINNSLSIRTKAQLIIALSKRILSSKEFPIITSYSPIEQLKKFAEDLIYEYQKSKDSEWNWFENILTYGNAYLPLSLFYAYQILKEENILQVALESLDFLIKSTHDDQKNCFSFPGNKGWYPKNQKKAIFDQQPIEAGSTVETCCSAYQITKQEKYLDFAKKAFLWYSGRNILGLSLIDEESSGIKDGLEVYGINQNQGAESILSYLLAYHSLEETIQK